jgi:hypothetical protein
MEKVRAWMYAGTIVTLLLSRHSLVSRKSHGRDDTGAAPA